MGERDLMANTLEGLVAAYLAETKTRKLDLAAAFGCSDVTLNRKLRGESDLTVSEARKLAGLIGATLDEVCRLAPDTGSD